MPANDVPPGVRKNPIANRTLAQSYAALPARTRLLFGLVACAVGGAGLAIADILEEKIPAQKSNATDSQQRGAH
ncbi:hypothetical protein LshimejAT787_0301210 [Lyophyllum shimeji]|uniref:Uncharacterized protein n=1 Tax=Lyophyllum shimeji TaxID=47721 RepID=A0A9P3PH49_LYOSH|nr:hypothetical protein LshimejAT787_0301210 [Lyophyllum shimeji]